MYGSRLHIARVSRNVCFSMSISRKDDITIFTENCGEDSYYRHKGTQRVQIGHVGRDGRFLHQVSTDCFFLVRV